jgi:glycosyltransferase involved in cell wall biosynthesis
MSRFDGPRGGLVSVMVPAYNAAETILETLQSVHRQVYRPIELTVVNDGSTDSTADIANEFGRAHADSEFHVRVVHQANSGLIASRRRGLAESTGPYLQFLDADDILHPRKLEMSVPLLASGVAEVVVSRTKKFRRFEDIAPDLDAGPALVEWTPSQLRTSTITSNYWHSVGPLFLREVVVSAGGFPRNVNPVIEEMEFHGRVKLLSPKVRYMPEVLNFYRVGNNRSVTGALDRLYWGRVEGGMVALELLQEAKNESDLEWRSLKAMALKTMYQVAARSEDRKLHEEAWKVLKTIVLAGGNGLERVAVAMAGDHRRVCTLFKAFARLRARMAPGAAK